MSSKLEIMPWSADEGTTCRCNTCRKFRQQDVPWRPPHHYDKNGLGVWYWKNPLGHCDLCYSPHKDFVDFVPIVVQEFVGPRLCSTCRNVISSYVLHEWKLCFMWSPDDAIKWALTDMYRNQFLHHLYHPPRHSGSGYHFEFIPRECCKHNHGRRRKRL